MESFACRIFQQFLYYLKVKSGEMLLDIGCGKGELLNEANKLGLQTYGVDISEKAINIAKKMFQEQIFIAFVLKNYPFKLNILIISCFLVH